MKFEQFTPRRMGFSRKSCTPPPCWGYQVENPVMLQFFALTHPGNGWGDLFFLKFWHAPWNLNFIYSTPWNLILISSTGGLGFLSGKVHFTNGQKYNKSNQTNYLTRDLFYRLTCLSNIFHIQSCLLSSIFITIQEAPRRNESN